MSWFRTISGEIALYEKEFLRHYNKHKKEKIMDKFSAKFTTNPDLVFHDISNEDYRVYNYPIGRVRINKPLAVSWKGATPEIPGGRSHRVVDQDLRCYYLPAGWLSIEWEKIKKGTFPFEF